MFIHILRILSKQTIFHNPPKVSVTRLKTKYGALCDHIKIWSHDIGFSNLESNDSISGLWDPANSYHETPWWVHNRETSPIICPLCGKFIGYGWNSLTKPLMLSVDNFRCNPERAFEETFDLPVIWGAITLMWWYSNAHDVYVWRSAILMILKTYAN